MRGQSSELKPGQNVPDSLIFIWFCFLKNRRSPRPAVSAEPKHLPPPRSPFWVSGGPTGGTPRGPAGTPNACPGLGAGGWAFCNFTFASMVSCACPAPPPPAEPPRRAQQRPRTRTATSARRALGSPGHVTGSRRLSPPTCQIGLPHLAGPGRPPQPGPGTEVPRSRRRGPRGRRGGARRGGTRDRAQRATRTPPPPPAAPGPPRVPAADVSTLTSAHRVRISLEGPKTWLRRACALENLAYSSAPLSVIS
ncbi:proline-rich proteoglycan 2-like isoform X1 [Oryctolagus cuniculus]|uniref:proline-rich proteoglycan 2-like isoform X1 n=1 Tax=Oryctolagus cuniculus TaxID=9986 RepID=UPI0038798C83